MKTHWLLSVFILWTFGQFFGMTSPSPGFEKNFNEMRKWAPRPTSNLEGHDISLCPAHGRSYRQPYCRQWLLDVKKQCFDLFVYYICNFNV